MAWLPWSLCGCQEHVGLKMHNYSIQVFAMVSRTVGAYRLGRIDHAGATMSGQQATLTFRHKDHHAFQVYAPTVLLTMAIDLDSSDSNLSPHVQCSLLKYQPPQFARGKNLKNLVTSWGCEIWQVWPAWRWVPTQSQSVKMLLHFTQTFKSPKRSVAQVTKSFDVFMF